jgi:hypothetical protein
LLAAIQRDQNRACAYFLVTKCFPPLLPLTIYLSLAKQDNICAIAECQVCVG